jgi:site-specific recombinase XerD
MFAGVHLGFADDPTSDLVSPRAGPSLPKPLSEAEVEALLEAPDGGRPRACAIVHAGATYASGLRVSEVVSLPRDRVDVESGIPCTGKGGRERPSLSESPPARLALYSNVCARSSTAGDRPPCS